MTEESPALPAPSPPPAVEVKLKAVLSSMAEAVTELLQLRTASNFGQAARMCVMGQKISTELITTAKQANAARGLQAAMAAGAMGAEGQYIAQGGGDVEGYVEDQRDYAILNHGVEPNYIGPMGAGVMVHRPNDQATLMRDLMLMVQTYFNDQKKAAGAEVEKGDAEAARMKRYEIYTELNQALRAKAELKAQDPDSPLLAKLEKQIQILVDLVAEGDPDDTESPKPDVVPAELLRGHPPGARLESGDALDPGGPVLHREDRGEGADQRGEAGRHCEEAVG